MPEFVKTVESCQTSREKTSQRDEICLTTPDPSFVKSLTCGHRLYGAFPSSRGNSIFSWQSTIVKMGEAEKALPTMMPEIWSYSPSLHRLSLHKQGGKWKYQNRGLKRILERTIAWITCLLVGQIARCEDSQFCHYHGVSHLQLQFGNPISYLID
ncbi:hypothetical protein Tco_1524891 [Tanacetum coccineum]